MNNYLWTVMKGMGMGMAEVVPGVSGGTIALITGIYDKLILTIKSVDIRLMRAVISRDWLVVKDSLEWSFIISLGIGMLLGIGIGVFGITYLFEHYPEPLWGFFFGLILSSCIYVARQTEKWSRGMSGWLILGFLIAYGITLFSPAEGSDSLIYVFFSGVIAICALVLPGISGSFILLLMGMYTIVIPAVKNVLSTLDLSDMVLVMVFGMGCLLGLAGFSRVMNYLLHHFRQSTLAILIGFMLGSLNKIWPWRNINSLLDKELATKLNVQNAKDLEGIDLEAFRILSESNVSPAEYWMNTPKVEATVIAMIFGFVLLFLIDYIASKKSTTI